MAPDGGCRIGAACRNFDGSLDHTQIVYVLRERKREREGDGLRCSASGAETRCFDGRRGMRWTPMEKLSSLRRRQRCKRSLSTAPDFGRSLWPESRCNGLLLLGSSELSSGLPASKITTVTVIHRHRLVRSWKSL